MKFWASFCRVLGTIWLVLASILILIGIVGVWMERGFSGVQNILSPFNVLNWAVTLVVLAPGIGLRLLSDKLNRKLNESVN